MYWEKIPPVVAKRLDEVAELLDAGRHVRHSFATLGDVNPESRAADELKIAQIEFGDRDLSLRVHRQVILWGVIAADLLAGIAALARGRSVIFAPFPLVRAVIEHCTRIVWLLDPDPNTVPRRRFARALLDELLSADEACRATSHLGGRGSEAHKKMLSELRRLRRDEVPKLGPDFDISGGPTKWQISDERLLRPTEAIEHFGRRWGQSGEQWVGVYDALSGYSHPTQLGWEFYAISGGSPILTTDTETIEKSVSYALIPFYQALRHHLSFNGWTSSVLDQWETDINSVFPGMILNSNNKPK